MADIFSYYKQDILMSRMQNIGIFLLRVATSCLMLTHGLPKLLNFGEMLQKFPDPIGVGVTLSVILVIGAEFFCSVLIILGVATRLMVVPLIITMLVAAFIVHAEDPFVKKEFPLLYAVIYTSLLFLGSGAYSLGSRLFKNKLMH